MKRAVATLCTRLGDIAGGETIDAAVSYAEQGEADH
jgi:hypothetical protein